MRKFRIAIIEDNVYERRMLKEQLVEVVKNYSLDEYDDGESFLDANERYDILFLDYEMPGMNGIQVAEIYRKKWPKTVIVFVSCHDEVLPQGYRVHAYQFLVKPARKEDLEEIMARISEEFEYQALKLEFEGKHYLVPVRSVLYIESGKHGNGVVIRTEDRVYRDSGTMQFYEEFLNAKCFVRVNRSYIVNLRWVETWKNDRITLRNGERARLSLRKRKYFEHKLDEFKWETGYI